MKSVHSPRHHEELSDGREDKPDRVEKGVRELVELIMGCTDRQRVINILNDWLPFQNNQFDRVAHAHQVSYPIFHRTINRLCGHSVTFKEMVEGKSRDGKDLIQVILEAWTREQHRRNPQLALEVSEPACQPHTGISD